MLNPLIFIHATLGELAGLAYLWVFVEILNPSTERFNRALKASLVGVILMWSSLIIGGYYYINTYSPTVKTVIANSSAAWTQTIIMETKEHIFLLLPFLSLLAHFILKSKQKTLYTNPKYRRAFLGLCLTIFTLTLIITLMGLLISTGYRTGLETLNI